jgi:hypothetical protein
VFYMTDIFLVKLLNIWKGHQNELPCAFIQ